MAIRSFADDAVKVFFEQGRISGRVGWINVARIVARKIDMLHYSAELRDLGSPPGS
ncbi:MAG: hypothetical protein AABO58_12825 [Acidobacteriota bacterium]